MLPRYKQAKNTFRCVSFSTTLSYDIFFVASNQGTLFDNNLTLKAVLLYL